MDYGVLRTLLDSVWVIDSERRLVFLNEAAARTLGVPLRRVKLATPMHDWIQWEDPALFCMPGGDWGQAQATAYREVTYRCPKQGRSGRAQVSIQPIAGKGHWMVLARDVTLEEALHRKYRAEMDAKERALAELRRAHGRLERKVAERTVQLSELNRTLAAMMDSLGQGFLVVDPRGACSGIHSKACLELLECDPARRALAEVLRLDPAQAASMRSWLELVFEEKLPFEDLAALGPTRYSHSQGRRILLEYHAIRGEKREPVALVVVATDRTREWEAERQAEEEKRHARRIVSILRSKSAFLRLWRALRDLEANLRGLDEAGGRLGPLERKNWMRALHTYKGEAASFYLSEIAASLHALEDDVQGGAGGTRGLASLAEGLKRLEEELPGLGIDVGKGLEDREIAAKEGDVAALREALLASGAPRQVLEQFDDRLLRAPLSGWLPQWEAGLEASCRVAGKLGALRSFGADQVRVEPERWNAVADALVHAFRNIADHGLELPEEREKAGKPPTGQVTLEARRLPGPGASRVELAISDDGRGIDVKRLRERIGESSLTDEGVLDRLLGGGVSSNGSVSSLSGRGAGLEAIAHAVRALGGSVRIETALGKGTRLVLSVPDAPFGGSKPVPAKAA